jgi:hypothetical protein
MASASYRNWSRLAECFMVGRKRAVADTAAQGAPRQSRRKPNGGGARESSSRRGANFILAGPLWVR